MRKLHRGLTRRTCVELTEKEKVWLDAICERSGYRIRELLLLGAIMADGGRLTEVEKKDEVPVVLGRSIAHVPRNCAERYGDTQG
jgi:hypothetical protein